jgi:hypothetical protein
VITLAKPVKVVSPSYGLEKWLRQMIGRCNNKIENTMKMLVLPLSLLKGKGKVVTVLN